MASTPATEASTWLKHAEAPGYIFIDDSTCGDQTVLQQLRQFNYSVSCIAPGNALLEDCEGCQCTSCSENTCTCTLECQKGLEALQRHGRAAGVVSLLECGPACSCGPSNCTARPTQQGISVPVTLVWHPEKGWCVRTLAAMRQGAFVCEYAGEYVSMTEAQKRLNGYDQHDRGHALLTVRLQLPSHSSSLRCCIDATNTGNIARFINHSCDGGNLEAILVSSKGSFLPRVALFAARDISAGEELTYAYCQTSVTGERAASTRRCFCGTAACSGFLPSAI